jgi:ADP-ribose pyrophosphatase YjhB (NUDIX family)
MLCPNSDLVWLGSKRSAAPSGYTYYWCENCHAERYLNPKVGVAAIIKRDDEFLLVRRRKKPKRGKWTLPAGFVDHGEPCEKSIIREVKEEVCVDAEVDRLFSVYDVLDDSRGHVVLVVFKVIPKSYSFSPSDDVDRVGWFSTSELPTIAFASVRRAIEGAT